MIGYNEPEFTTKGSKQMKSLDSYTLTVEDIAEKLGYSTQRVRTLAATGKIPALKRVRMWLFNEAEVLAALTELNPKSVADNNANNRRATDGDHSASDLLR